MRLLKAAVWGFFVAGSPIPSSSEWSADYKDDWDVTEGRAGWHGVFSSGSVPAVLLPQNHSHDLPPTPSPEQIKQMEEDTHRQFELLKVSASVSRQGMLIERVKLKGRRCRLHQMESRALVWPHEFSTGILMWMFQVCKRNVSHFTVTHFDWGMWNHRMGVSWIR